MTERIVEFVSSLPPEAATAVLATIPVFELRAALPIGIAVFGLHPLAAFAWSYLGNLLPLVAVYAVLPPLLRFATARSPVLKRILDRYFRYLERKYQGRYDRYGRAVLLVFVAVPLPGSGVWTASVLAILFGIEKRYAIPAILVGLAVSAAAVLLLTQGAIHGLPRF